MGLNDPDMAIEMTVEAQLCTSIFHKCLPKSQFGFKCGRQYSRSGHRNDISGSSWGLNIPEVFTEIIIWAQVLASIFQKCLPKSQLKLKCGL